MALFALDPQLEKLIQNNPYKEVPKLPESRLEEISGISRITEVADFDPAGDSSGRSMKWPMASKAVLIRDNYSCRICGRSELSNFSTADQYNKLHLAVQVHHIVPRKDGGKNTFRNLITLCEECHRKTFSNDYSGLPVSGQTTIYKFEKKVNLCVRREWVERFHNVPAPGKLRDYVRAFDSSSSRYRIAARKGESVPIFVAQLGVSHYKDLCEIARTEANAADYVTLYAETESGKEKVRFFLTEDGELIV
ncbi:MAG TPA: HNH endonuclease [Thermoplasmataceae archaeon]|nr:HNH endonuclease [Thermoplasmataceae archaeon]